MIIERLHIHSNKNDVNNFCNFSDIMPYLRHIVVPTLRDIVLHFLSILITARALKPVQQYGRLNTVNMVIFVFIFVTVDMQTLYTSYIDS